jgi:hypothetical protein
MYSINLPIGLSFSANTVKFLMRIFVRLYQLVPDMTFYIWLSSQDIDGNGEISFDEVRRSPPLERSKTYVPRTV